MQEGSNVKILKASITFKNRSVTKKTPREIIKQNDMNRKALIITPVQLFKIYFYNTYFPIFSSQSSNSLTLILTLQLADLVRASLPSNCYQELSPYYHDYERKLFFLKRWWFAKYLRYWVVLYYSGKNSLQTV